MRISFYLSRETATNFAKILALVLQIIMVKERVVENLCTEMYVQVNSGNIDEDV